MFGGDTKYVVVKPEILTYFIQYNMGALRINEGYIIQLVSIQCG